MPTHTQDILLLASMLQNVQCFTIFGDQRVQLCYALQSLKEVVCPTDVQRYFQSWLQMWSLTTDV